MPPRRWPKPGRDFGEPTDRVIEAVETEPCFVEPSADRSIPTASIVPLKHGAEFTEAAHPALNKKRNSEHAGRDQTGPRPDRAETRQGRDDSVRDDQDGGKPHPWT